MAVRLSAVDAVIRSKPRLTRFSTDIGLGSSIAFWMVQVRAGELALSISSPLPQQMELTTALLQQLHSQHQNPSSFTSCSDNPSPASCLAGMWSEDEDPVTAAPRLSVSFTSPAFRKKHRLRHRAGASPCSEPWTSSKQLPKSVNEDSPPAEEIPVPGCTVPL